MTEFAAACLIVWLATALYVVRLSARQRRLLRAWRQRTAPTAGSAGLRITNQQDFPQCG
jgi:CcmD family protein